MFTSLGFTFNGKHSKNDFGFINVRINESTTSEPFWGNREIVEDRLLKTNKNYLMGVSKHPIEFDLTLMLDDTSDASMTHEKRLQLAQWLLTDDYCPLVLDDNPEKMYYCMVTNPSEIFLFPNNAGYFTVHMRTKHPHALTPVYTNTFDLSTNTGITNIELYNNSNCNKFYYGEYQITLKGTDTGFTFSNITVGNESMIFSGLNQNETIYVNCEKQEIVSLINDVPSGLWRIDNFQEPKQWLRLVQGKNIIAVSGHCVIETRFQYPIIA